LAEVFDKRVDIVIDAVCGSAEAFPEVVMPSDCDTPVRRY
jgi:hypothetical protein